MALSEQSCPVPALPKHKCSGQGGSSAGAQTLSGAQSQRAQHRGLVAPGRAGTAAHTELEHSRDVWHRALPTATARLRTLTAAGSWREMPQLNSSHRSSQKCNLYLNVKPYTWAISQSSCSFFNSFTRFDIL